jgi:hypothetical protein
MSLLMFSTIINSSRRTCRLPPPATSKSTDRGSYTVVQVSGLWSLAYNCTYTWYVYHIQTYSTGNAKLEFDISYVKTQYLNETIAMVVAKKDARQGGTAESAPTPVEKAAAVVDISIPYDAAALLAYD